MNIKKSITITRIILPSSMVLGGLLHYKIRTKTENIDITAARNKLFTISLQSNSTTGAQWYIKSLPESIELVSQKYIKDSSNPNLVGTGGHEIFTFKGLYPTRATITLEYKREWEKTDPWKIVHYRIAITE